MFNYKPYIISLAEFMLKNGYTVKPLPKVILKKDKQDGLFIKTKNGILQVLEIQGENAKRMNIGDFLRGNPINEFEIFES